VHSDRTRDEIEQWSRARAGEVAPRENLAELARTIAVAELRRRGLARDQIDDLAQEVVRSTLAFLSKGQESPRDLRAFLKFRAWGVLSDHRKRMRAAPALADPEHVPEMMARDSGPDQRAHRSQLERALAECKSRLSDEQREAIELRYASRLDSDAIATRLAVHRNTVNVRVFRALEKLRECLARKGFDAGDLSAEGA
jgi:RNA polymerase sigma-70 factor (ECF subfamily)